MSPESPEMKSAPSPQGEELAQSLSPAPEPTPSTSRRQALRQIRRELTDSELSSPGVQKLILDDLERAENECDVLSAYVTRFHDADKRAAVLEEKLHTNRAIDIAFGVGLTIGGTLIGLASSLWDKQPYGYLSLVIGLFLALGAAGVRSAKQ